MNKQKRNSRDQKEQVNPKCLSVKPIPVIDEDWVFKSTKVSHFKISDYSRNTRVSSRALTSPNTFPTLDVKSTQLALMDTSAVVPARCGSSKGVNLFNSNIITKSFNRQGVSGVNLFNILPSDQIITERIKNLDSFVKENHLRVNKDLIADRADQGAPNYGNDKTKVESIIKNMQVEHGANHQKGHTGKEIATFRSKNFSVAHQSIFSCTQLKWVA